jgi:two-component system alkaline phosphatase synthesis response regulator PhoP
MEKINKKILIVEDDKDFLYILQTKFAGAGFDVSTAENGEDGLEMAGKEKPDLIISDVLIPKMDGIQMVKKILEINKAVSIIFLTNIKDEEHNADTKELAGIEYLIKSEMRINDVVEKVKGKLGLA